MQQLDVAGVMTIGAGRGPGRVAATMGAHSVTFAEVVDGTERVTRSLAARGVGRGTRVGWWGDTTLDVIPLWFAAARLGAIFVPLNPRFTPAEARQLLDVADPSLVVGDDAHECDVTMLALLADRTSTGLSASTVSADERDPHVIFFTSGSSGQPKGVVLSQRTERLRTMTDATLWPSGPVVCMFPQFHMAGWHTPMTAWGSADEVVYVERADAESLLAAVHSRRAVRLYAIPAVWRRILEADRSAYDLSSLHYCDTGTSATTPELLRAIADAFPGCETSITYGSTEAGGVCRLWPVDVHRKPGSVGPPAPGCHVRLSTDGELLVRNPFLMDGYFGDEEATAAALVDGWYRSGDLATCDEDGCYAIVGRASELIRTGGETVAPAEVDAVLQAIPGVADGAACGVPDPDWGEHIAAFVVLEPGADLDLAGLRRRCEGRLASYKHPRQLIVVDALPRTGATRQVQRRVLAQWASERYVAAPPT